VQFCRARSLDPFKGTPSRPVLNWGRGDGRELSDNHVRLWVTAMGKDPGLRWKTISVYFTALKRYEIDHATPGRPLQQHRFAALLEGIHREKGDSAQEEEKDARRPFSAELLRNIEQKCLGDKASRSYEEKLFMAAAAVGVGGLLRANEFVSVGPTQREEAVLRISQLTFFRALDNAQNVTLVQAVSKPGEVDHCVLHLKCSKTDQRKKGQNKYLAGNTVRSLLNYLACHPTVQDGNSVLFVHHDGTSLTRKELVDMMREHLRKMGVPEDQVLRYSGHSFRKGGAESLESQGANDSVIMSMGGWTSDAHKRYHSGKKEKHEAAKLLGRDRHAK